MTPQPEPVPASPLLEYIDPNEARLLDIMAIATALSWFRDNPSGYPLMQASEVEKCILMALDDHELARYRADAACPAIRALVAP